jgi:hypothetical protein
MAIALMPTTRTGAWGLWLSVAFAIIFTAKITGSLALPSLLIFFVGIAGLVTNVIAVVRHERAILFFLVGILVGLFIVFWIGGEVLFPH